MVPVMQSYAAARSLFTFLAAVAWCAIMGGGVILMMALSFVSQFNTQFPAMISAAIPGLAICLFGFLALAMVQIGRASVDSAEYGQQALQVARDQLAFARQVHLETRGEVAAPVIASSEPVSSSAPTDTKHSRPEPPVSNTTLSFDQPSIIKDPIGGYRVANQTFATFGEAKRFLDSRPIWSR